MMIVIHWRFIIKKPSQFKLKPYLYLGLDNKTEKPKDCLSNNVSQNTKKNLEASDSNTSANRTKGVKLGFEYDHVAPSGFSVAPIKRVPTTMFSLVRIQPMFEQEAPY